MMPDRRPVSARHAFALALDLALRRDALQSLLVPLLLSAPWSVALALMSSSDDAGLLLRLAALAGGALTSLTVGSMLRVRARSMFGAAPGTRPALATECYARGLSRVPWLLVTELVRLVLVFIGFALFLIPGLFFAFRWAVATEAVVLDEPNQAAAFRRSRRLTAGGFDHWLAMALLTAACYLTAWLGVAVVMAALQAPVESWGYAWIVAVAPIGPVVQYAWTFYYLRLAEADSPGIEVGPLYAGPEPAPAPVAVGVPDGEAVTHVLPPAGTIEDGTSQV